MLLYFPIANKFISFFQKQVGPETRLLKKINLSFRTVLDLEKNYKDSTESFQIPHTVSFITNMLHSYDIFVIINEQM